MNERLVLFEFFHKLKNFTTASYSAKKLQDILERKLDDPNFDLKEVVEWFDTWSRLNKDIEVSLTEIGNVIAQANMLEKVGLRKTK